MMRPLLLVCCLLAPVLHAAEQLATVLQQSPLQAEPYTDATQLASLAARQQVRVLQRQGGWYQVEGGGHTGWLRMSHLRFGDAPATEASSSGLAQTLRLFSTGRSEAGGVTVATGIRGLDSADLANASPDHQAVERLERFQAKPKQARQFAQDVMLKSQPLGYLGAN